MLNNSYILHSVDENNVRIYDHRISSNENSYSHLQNNIHKNDQRNVRRDSKYISNNHQANKRYSMMPPRVLFNRTNRRSTADSKRRTAFMDNNIHRYQERLIETENNIRQEIDNMPLSKRE